MSNLDIKLNGNPAHPTNLEEISIKLDFRGETKNPQVNADNIDFVLEDATAINDWIATNGVVEGMPITFDFTCDGTTETILTGCLDLTQVKAGCDTIEVPIKETGRIDWFNDVAPSVYFPYLASTQAVLDNVTPAAIISKSDYIPIPYVVSEIPNYTQAALLGISTFVIAKEIAHVTSELIAVSADTASIVGIGAAVGIIAGLVVYEGILIFAAVKLVQSLLDNLVQKTKYKYGMKVVTMFEKGCAYLDLKFQSSFLQSYPFNQLVYIPTKINTLKRKERDDKKNPEAFGYYDGNFADFVRDFNDVFNVEQILFSSDGKTMIYESYNNNLVAGSYQMPSGIFVFPDINDNTNPRAEPVITNAQELATQYVVKYKLDRTELNTYDLYNGTEAQMQLIPKSVLNIKNHFTGRYVSKNLNFHLAKRKETLTGLETVLKTLIDSVNGLYQFLVDRLNAIIDPIQAVVNALTFTIPEIPTIDLLNTGTFIDTPVNILIGTINGIITVIDFVIKLLNAIIAIPQTVINLVADFVNALPPTLLSQDFNRIGYMLLSNDFMGQKLCIVNSPATTGYLSNDYRLLNDNSIADSHQNYTSAGYIMDRFHSSKFGHYLRGNQYLLFPEKEIPFCCTDFINIKENNVFLCDGSVKARMDTIDYSIIQDYAKADFRIPQVYEKNHYEFITIDGDTNYIDGVLQPTKE